MSGGLGTDPGSVSAAGATAYRTGAVLTAQADALAALLDPVDRAWPGRASLPTRRALRALAENLAALAEVSTATGRVLQDHAVSTSELAERARQVEQAVAGAGRRIDGGVVRDGWGISGPADAGRERSAAADRLAQQRELDAVALHLGRRRADLDAALTESLAAVREVRRRLRATGAPGRIGGQPPTTTR